ncbi:MAG: 16S rRNA (adenine(1518)-N(6)/adenine(1519)-N(6))-dimethyltransferase RsmA [Gammaproteobacteria bacterium]|jgi:16S rRNA (adenine1518-N6/adenine1519-N6)-dimethyltransferase
MSHGSPRKRFGQNFLHDANIIDKIIRSMAPEANDHFVEIGPGRGAITRPLSKLVGHLDAIEIDRDLADDLERQPWAGRITIHRADALRFAFDELSTQPESLRLIGNLPYNISTPLLFHILHYCELFRDIHVMLQKEVVQRMAASPGSKEYGRLSVALAAHVEVSSLFTISAGSFTPAPKVQSAFARLTPLPQPLVSAAEQPVFDAILRAAFGQRRKQLGNALDGQVTADEIRAAGVDPKQRAEMLSVDEFVALARAAGTRPIPGTKGGA